MGDTVPAKPVSHSVEDDSSVNVEQLHKLNISSNAHDEPEELDHYEDAAERLSEAESGDVGAVGGDNPGDEDEQGEGSVGETNEQQRERILRERGVREMEMSEQEREEKRTEAKKEKVEGNRLFKESTFVLARDCYSEGLDVCPLCFSEDRAVLFANRAACFSHLENPEAAIEDCTEAIKLNPHYVKALQRRAGLYETSDKLDESVADHKAVLEVDPHNRDSTLSAMKLGPLIEERNQKLKDEMFGKLKSLGNTLLGPFGLSTDNFKLNQDPKTGSYSVNFQQKP